MTHIWSGLSMCHLQAYPSKMQILFSQRKDNIPKRCFPDNNLGQEGGSTLPSALHWESRPTVLIRSFSRLKQANPYLHILALLFEPTQGCHKTVTAWRRLGTLWSISTGLCWHWRAWWLLLFGTPIFASWTHSWWSLKQTNWWKLKLWSLKTHDCDETVTKHMIFLFIEIPGKPGAGMYLST